MWYTFFGLRGRSPEMPHISEQQAHKGASDDMGIYYVEVYGSVYPSTGRQIRVHRKHPDYDALSPDLYCLWQVWATSTKDAVAQCLSGSGNIIIGHDWITGENKLTAAVAEAR